MYSLLLQLAYGLLSLLAPSTADDGLTVPTQQGSVVGALLNPKTRQFLGIPYAADTSLWRFQPPMAPPVRSQPFSATNWGDSCPMELSNATRIFLTLAGLLDQQLNVSVSENCLNLNIWAPAMGRPQKTAVMIWVYGGSGKFGTSNTVPYNGTYFTNQYDDVTIVTINYRTNIFGFPNAPGTLNVGLLDIEAAVQWVYKNIANFGGDPERITLFGESFGSVAVDAYAYSHPKDTIVKGLILESGVVDLVQWLAPKPNAWNTLAINLGCSVPSLQIKCMQSLPWKVVEDAIIKYGIGFSASPDGYTMFSDWPTRQKNGNYLQVPALIGNNANEGDMFAKIYQATGNWLPQELFDVASAAVTDVLFHCPAANSSNVRRTKTPATYRYEYAGVFDDITNKTANLRAFHTTEIPLVFNTYNLSSFPYPPTPTEVALGNFIQGSWVAFAQNPNGGLGSYGWREYHSNDELWPSINVLGDAKLNPTGIAYQSTLKHDLGCKDLDASVEWAKRIMGQINW